MKKAVIYLFIVIAFANGIVEDDTPIVDYITTPEITFIDIQNKPDDKYDMALHWNHVESTNLQDPVTGYRLKVWEVKEKRKIFYKTVNGERVPSRVFYVPKMKPDPGLKPSIDLRIPVRTNSSLVPNISAKVSYFFRAYAFSSYRRGNWSRWGRMRHYPQYPWGTPIEDM